MRLPMSTLGQVLSVLKSIDSKLGKVIANQEKEIRLLEDIQRSTGRIR
ncbi:MAG TPA: hypothetical protein VD862_00780 [Candidatus Paceibacterota bacterium]|nr:hypothetical protein [Candidatus Paceibacterota bacterium]